MKWLLVYQGHQIQEEYRGVVAIRGRSEMVSGSMRASKVY